MVFYDPTGTGIDPPAFPERLAGHSVRIGAIDQTAPGRARCAADLMATLELWPAALSRLARQAVASQSKI